MHATQRASPGLATKSRNSGRESLSALYSDSLARLTPRSHRRIADRGLTCLLSLPTSSTLTIGCPDRAALECSLNSSLSSSRTSSGVSSAILCLMVPWLPSPLCTSWKSAPSGKPPQRLAPGRALRQMSFAKIADNYKYPIARLCISREEQGVVDAHGLHACIICTGQNEGIRLHPAAQAVMTVILCTYHGRASPDVHKTSNHSCYSPATRRATQGMPVQPGWEHYMHISTP